MKAHYLGEENLHNRLNGVWVNQQDEIVVFAKPVNHREDDTLPANARKCLDDV
jgi:hypothetical protein